MSEPLLPVAIHNVSKKFGERQALNGISLTLNPGESLGLLGPNGAGKSTLIRAMAGLRRPDSGEIRIFGHPAGHPAAKALLGYVPQELAIYPILSPRENLLSFGRYQGMRGKQLEDAIERCLRWTGLEDRKNDKSSHLSGGMRRRLNMAAGAIHGPKLFLLDEPTVGVDPQSRERIYEMIGELRREGVSLIYTSHYMEEVERLCDRIAIVDHGRVIAVGTRQELVRQTIGEKQLLQMDCGVELPASLKEQLTPWNVVVDGLSVRATVARPAEDMRELLGLFHSQNVPVRNLNLSSPTLESVFLHLTGKELRE
jgi:ABC-2 type transport system ATP-binding protein